jgi:hypothetical protein
MAIEEPRHDYKVSSNNGSPNKLFRRYQPDLRESNGLVKRGIENIPTQNFASSHLERVVAADKLATVVTAVLETPETLETLGIPETPDSAVTAVMAVTAASDVDAGVGVVVVAAADVDVAAAADVDVVASAVSAALAASAASAALAVAVEEVAVMAVVAAAAQPDLAERAYKAHLGSERHKFLHSQSLRWLLSPQRNQSAPAPSPCIASSLIHKVIRVAGPSASGWG